MNSKYITLVIFLLMACTKRPAENVNSQNADNPIQIDFVAFQDSLSNLPVDMSSSVSGLDLFRNKFDKQKEDQNDKAFKAYLEFQAKLMDTLNIQLYNRPDYDKVNSLVWADASEHDQVGLDYEKELNKNGLILKSTEGTIYIGRSTEPIRSCFYDHLSASTKEFFDQFESETNHEFSEDGMILISPHELADLLAFWDSFLTKYPNHLFEEFAVNNKNFYLLCLLDGMDNTPAFDYETKAIDPTFLDSYTYLINNYPSLGITVIITEYVDLLKNNNNQRTDGVGQFIKKYSIR
jgi:hypothetical protein